jgi:hypothetical protein
LKVHKDIYNIVVEKHNYHAFQANHPIMAINKLPIKSQKTQLKISAIYAKQIENTQKFQIVC